MHGRGACMVVGGMRGRGGMHGRGACMAGGVWWGVHGWGCAWQAGGLHAMHTPSRRYYGYGIRSMSGRYTSYWNAFLFELFALGGGRNAKTLPSRHNEPPSETLTTQYSSILTILKNLKCAVNFNLCINGTIDFFKLR